MPPQNNGFCEFCLDLIPKILIKEWNRKRTLDRKIYCQEDFMEINTKREDKALVVSVSGRMDAVTASDFENALTEFIDQGDNSLVIDFSDLDYISSAGLRSILGAAKKMKGLKGKLFLANLKEVVKEVFDISGFSAIIPIYDSVETALEAM